MLCCKHRLHLYTVLLVLVSMRLTKLLVAVCKPCNGTTMSNVYYSANNVLQSA
jgi:hypothetical protein